MIVVSDSTPLRYLVFIELENVLPSLFGGSCQFCEISVPEIGEIR
jgi:hypothetical protein